MATVQGDYVTPSEFDLVGEEDHEPETKRNCIVLQKKVPDTHLCGMCQKTMNWYRYRFLLDEQIGSLCSRSTFKESKEPRAELLS